MKSLFLFVAFSALFTIKNGFSQGTVPAPDRSFKATRYDHGSTVPGYASAPLTLTMKASSFLGGTATSAQTYPASNTTQRSHFSTTALFTSPFTFQITGMFPGNVSGWYSLPTTIGGETFVSASDAGMTYHSGGYGFSVTVKCVATRTYEIRPTRFECYTIPCPVIPTDPYTEVKKLNEAPVVFPNPAHTAMNLTVHADADQSLNIVITDVLGRKVLSTQQDAKAGRNVLPIATDQLSTGNYFVRFVVDNQATVLKFSKL